MPTKGDTLRRGSAQVDRQSCKFNAASGHLNAAVSWVSSGRAPSHFTIKREVF